MILTYIGNSTHLSNQELKDLLKDSNLNPTSRSSIAFELKSRNNWNDIL